MSINGAQARAFAGCFVARIEMWLSDAAEPSGPSGLWAEEDARRTRSRHAGGSIAVPWEAASRGQQPAGGAEVGARRRQLKAQAEERLVARARRRRQQRRKRPPRLRLGEAGLIPGLVSCHMYVSCSPCL